MAIIEGNLVRCQSAADVLDFFPMASRPRIVVEPGTYSFSNDTVQLLSGKHITFEGDVVFDDCVFKTETLVNTDYYDEYDVSSVTESGGVFTRSGGVGAWAAAAGWMLHVRDAWYSRSASDGTTFTAVETVVAAGLGSAQKYVLCSPTTHLYIEGSVKMTNHPAEIPLQLFGLADCNLGNWRVSIWPDADTSDLNLALFSHCAKTRFPAVDAAHHTFAGGTTNPRGPFQIQYCQMCEAERWFAGNMASDEATAGDLVGVYMTYCQDTKVHANIGGLDRSAGTGDAVGFSMDNCLSCQADGQVSELASTGGSAVDWKDASGTSNNFNILWR